MFRHALVRDVAYEQIPRARAGGEAPARSRVDRVARPSRGPRRDARAPLRVRARVRTRDRAERRAARGASPRSRCGRPATAPSRLNAFPPAARFYERALELWPDDDPSGPSFCSRSAAYSPDRRRRRAGERSRRRRRRCSRAGDRRARGRGGRAARRALVVPRRPDACDRHLERAHAFVQRPSIVARKARVLSQVSRYRSWRALTRRRFGSVKRRSPWPTSSGSSRSRLQALVTIGTAQSQLGDDGGLDDLERAVAIALAAGSSSVAARGQQPGACQSGPSATSAAGVELMDEAVATASDSAWRACSGSLGTSGSGCSPERATGTRRSRTSRSSSRPAKRESRTTTRDALRLSARGHPVGRDDVQGAARGRRKIVPLERGRSASSAARGSRVSRCVSSSTSGTHSRKHGSSRAVARRRRCDEPPRQRPLARSTSPRSRSELGCADALATVRDRARRQSGREAARRSVRGDDFERAAELLARDR